MKFLAVAVALLAAVSAKNIRIADVRDCGNFHAIYPILYILNWFVSNLDLGAADAVIRFSGAVKTDPVPVPGNMTMDLAVRGSPLSQNFNANRIDWKVLEHRWHLWQAHVPQDHYPLERQLRRALRQRIPRILVIDSASSILRSTNVDSIFWTKAP